MKLIIHRGAREIGGNCVELRTDNSRILVDFGMPLVDRERERFDSRVMQGKSVAQLQELGILPSIEGLYRGTRRSIDAILISHAHMDHYGLLDYADPEIPVYLSRGARELVEITDLFVRRKTRDWTTRPAEPRKPITFGDFKITPYLVDHSAFDARAFLIEADGRRVFYSGDFRGHGRKSVLFRRMIDHPLKNIDCLLMEGTMLGRGNQVYKNEEEVEKRITEILAESKTITFLFTSSQNIDRLVSAYRACLKTDSILAIDLYTALILDKLNAISRGIPRSDWKNIRIKFLKRHADALAEAGQKELLYRYNERKIKLDEIDEKKDRILMLARDNSVFPLLLKRVTGIRGARILYSMWEGYLTERFRGFCREKGLVLESVHTGGHAGLEYLREFAAALKPARLVPIHTFGGDTYPALFENVMILKDGEVLEI